MSSQHQSAPGYSGPAIGSKRTGSLGQVGEVYVTGRDEAAYAAVLRKALTAPNEISQAERAALSPLDGLYVRAANLAAKAALDPSGTTVAEHIELAQMRAELTESYGLDVP